MSIWTCKVLAGALFLALGSACVPVPELNSSNGALAEPLTTAKLSRGLFVSTPDGYCLDRTSLTREFALIARCDKLGAKGPSFGTPLAVITVTSPPDEVEATLPEADALIGDAESLLDSRRESKLQLVKISGSAPADGLSGRYWRAAGLVGNQVLGLAIYPVANGPDLDEEAVVLLRETFERSSETSISAAVAAQSAEDKPKKTRKGPFAGLFN